MKETLEQSVKRLTGNIAINDFYGHLLNEIHDDDRVEYTKVDIQHFIWKLWVDYKETRNDSR